MSDPLYSFQIHCVKRDGKSDPIYAIVSANDGIEAKQKAKKVVATLHSVDVSDSYDIKIVSFSEISKKLES